MLSCLKNKYMLGSVQLYETNPSKYKQDPLFKQTSKASSYAEFLDELSSNVNSKLQKLYKLTRQKIIENVIPVSLSITNSGSITYTYNESSVFCHVDTSASSEMQLKQIIGGVFVYNLIQSNISVKPFIIPYAKIFADIISKTNIRPLDYNDVFPYIARTTIYWLLKNNGLLSEKNFTAAVESMNVSFINKQEQLDFLENVNNISNVNDYITTISTYIKVNSSNLIVWLNNKLSLQFLIGLECLPHSLYMTYIAYILQYPSSLYFILERYKVVENIVKTLKKYEMR